MNPLCTERIRGGAAPGPGRVCRDSVWIGEGGVQATVEGTVQHIGEQMQRAEPAPLRLSASLCVTTEQSIKSARGMLLINTHLNFAAVAVPLVTCRERQ